MGKNLLETVVEQTNLPKELLEKELHLLLKDAQIPIEDLNIEALRKIMVNYLQDVFTEVKKEITIEK